jgi:carboxymethylenebutenolidase
LVRHSLYTLLTETANLDALPAAYDLKLWNRATPYLSAHATIVAGIVYANAVENHKLAITSIPVLQHFSGKMRKPPRSKMRVVHDYPKAQSHLFATPFQPEFDYNMDSVSHTRNLSFLKPLMKGPWFDLEAIWDEHTYWEFENRSVSQTMATMVQEPYVNHVPTVCRLCMFPWLLVVFLKVCVCSCSLIP